MRGGKQISVDLPDIKGRKQIVEVHLRNLKLSDTPDYISKRLAALTPSMSGADIANICNEGALIAARQSKKAVELIDFENAIDRVIGGIEKRSRTLSDRERRRVAYHEAGHAIAGWFLPHAYPLLKVSIVPRGVAALGYAQYQPRDQYLFTPDEVFLSSSLCVFKPSKRCETDERGTTDGGSGVHGARRKSCGADHLWKHLHGSKR